MGTQTWPKASVPYLVVPEDVVAEMACGAQVFWVPPLALAPARMRLKKGVLLLRAQTMGHRVPSL